MVFDPTKPVYRSQSTSAELRDNFSALAQHHQGALAPGAGAPGLGWIWLDTADATNWKLKVYSRLGDATPSWKTITEHAESIPVSAGVGADRQQVIYVGKHGSDSADGKTPGKAKLSFGAAITAAGTPVSGAAAVTVRGLDDGTYTEDIDTPSWVNICAPGASINTIAVEGHRIRDYCRWDIGSITCVERAVSKSHSDSSWSLFRCRRIDRTGTNNQSIRCAGGRLIIDVDLITGTGGAVSCAADTDGVDAGVYGRIGRVESLTGVSTGINCFCSSTGNAFCSLRIDSVFYAAGLVGNFAVSATTGAGTAKLDLSFGSIVGTGLTAMSTFTAGGGARVLNANGAYLNVLVPVATFTAGDEVNVICSEIDGGTNNLADGSSVRISVARRDGTKAGVPGANEDEDDGYQMFSMIYDSNAGDMYVCCDPSAGAAVWKKTTP